MRNKQKKRQNDILFILVSSFIVVVAWIGFNIYHIYITSTISEEVQLQLTPINGTFDMQTLEKLKNREKIVPKFERDQIATPSAPTPTVTQAPEEEEEVLEEEQTTPLTTEPPASGAAQTTTNQQSFSIQGQ